MNDSGELVWLDERRVHAIHDEQLKVHGGATGLRDAGLLASALARPVNVANYVGADIPTLAATYAIAITRNHPLIDGNKRTAYVCLELFLAVNGWVFPASDEEVIINMLELAGGEVTDEVFTTWVTRHAKLR